MEGVRQWPSPACTTSVPALIPPFSHTTGLDPTGTGDCCWHKSPIPILLARICARPGKSHDFSNSRNFLSVILVVESKCWPCHYQPMNSCFNALWMNSQHHGWRVDAAMKYTRCVEDDASIPGYEPGRLALAPVIYFVYNDQQCTSHCGLSTFHCTEHLCSFSYFLLCTLLCIY